MRRNYAIKPEHMQNPEFVDEVRADVADFVHGADPAELLRLVELVTDFRIDRDNRAWGFCDG